MRWVFLLLSGVILAAAGFSWLAQPVSNQELLANFAKAQDFLQAARSVGGLPWWTPMFLQGTSLAFSYSFVVTNAVILAFSIPLGFLIGPKIAMLACVGFGAVGMYVFLRKYTADEWCAIIGGAIFLFSPSLLTRAAGYEHFIVVCSMALLPWALFGILTFLRSPGVVTAVAAALAYAAVVLAYGKTGVMALPVVGLFVLAELLRQPREERPSLRLFLIAAGAFVLLAVVPNLPALRETGFVAMFQFGPFESWQHGFSTKSALGWIDRDGILTRGIAQGYAPTTAVGGTYLGLTVVFFLTLSLFRDVFHLSDLGRKARLFLAFGLMMFWFSFGPKSVIGGQFEFLALSIGARDFAPALGWFVLVAQVWMIFRLTPPTWKFRPGIATAISAVYLFVPGFRLIEWLPLYRNIRAPFDFFQVTGVLCVLFASAIAIRILAGSARRPMLRSGLAAGFLALMILDVAPFARSFFVAPMERAVFTDFLASQEYLKSSPVAGRVFAFSGRYFYLLTPLLSNRALVSEAFNSYLQQRDMALLQGAAFLSDENLRAYLNVAGVSHVLIDKSDPDTSPALRDRLSAFLQTGFENENFLVLVNESSLGQGFLARDFLQANDNDPSVAGPALGGAKYHLATIQMFGAASDEPGLRGRIVEGRISPNEGKSLEAGRPFEMLPPKAGETYQRVAFEPSSSDGWVVFNQAWHPDWRAMSGSKRLTIHRAFVGLSAVRTKAGEAVTFEFSPLWWYPVCIGLGGLFWAAAVVAVLSSFWRSRSQGRHDSAQSQGDVK